MNDDCWKTEDSELHENEPSFIALRFYEIATVINIQWPNINASAPTTQWLTCRHYRAVVASLNINVVTTCAAEDQRGGKLFEKRARHVGKYFKRQFSIAKRRAYRSRNDLTERNAKTPRCCAIVEFRIAGRILFIARRNEPDLNGIYGSGRPVSRSRERKLYILWMFMLVRKCVKWPGKRARYWIDNWGRRIVVNK